MVLPYEELYPSVTASTRQEVKHGGLCGERTINELLSSLQNRTENVDDHRVPREREKTMIDEMHERRYITRMNDYVERYWLSSIASHLGHQRNKTNVYSVADHAKLVEIAMENDERDTILEKVSKFYAESRKIYERESRIDSDNSILDDNHTTHYLSRGARFMHRYDIMDSENTDLYTMLLYSAFYQCFNARDQEASQDRLFSVLTASILSIIDASTDWCRRGVSEVAGSPITDCIPKVFKGVSIAPQELEKHANGDDINYSIWEICLKVLRREIVCMPHTIVGTWEPKRVSANSGVDAEDIQMESHRLSFDVNIITNAIAISSIESTMDTIIDGDDSSIIGTIVCKYKPRSEQHRRALLFISIIERALIGLGMCLEDYEKVMKARPVDLPPSSTVNITAKNGKIDNPTSIPDTSTSNESLDTDDDTILAMDINSELTRTEIADPLEEDVDAQPMIIVDLDDDDNGDSHGSHNNFHWGNHREGGANGRSKHRQPIQFISPIHSSTGSNNADDNEKGFLSGLFSWTN